MGTVEIVFNPVAGGGAAARARAVEAALHRRGIAARLRATGSRGDAEAMAREAAVAHAAGACSALLVAGGDGTLAEAANGLVGSTLPMGLVPAGTANVLACELGWPRDAEGIADLVAAGRSFRAGLGVADGRRFLLMAGIGLDAEVVAGMPPALKRRLGRLGYALFALRVLARRRPRLHEIEVDGERLRVAAAIVANARHYGGPYMLAPEAGLDRPGLQLVLLRDPGALAHLRAAAALAAGRMRTLGGVEIRAARSVAFAGGDGAPVQLDGDPAGHAPMRIGWLPDALTLLAPRRFPSRAARG